MTSLRLWAVKKLLDSSWTIVDHEYLQGVASQLYRLKAAVGLEPKSRLEAKELAEVKFQLARLEHTLERILHATKKINIQEEAPWEI